MYSCLVYHCIHKQTLLSFTVLPGCGIVISRDALFVIEFELEEKNLSERLDTICGHGHDDRDVQALCWMRSALGYSDLLQV